MSNHGSILIVEDTHASLKLLSQVLTAAGYEVRPADSGELALASVAARLPELILLDLRMPGMDGFEVMRRLKTQDTTRAVPVILLSAATELEQRLEGLRLGAVDFISKPYHQDELLARVRMHMELSHATAGLRSANDRLRHEVTKNQQASDALRASQALLDATSRIAKVGGWRIDLRTQSLSWTNEVYRIHEVDETFRPTVASAIDFYAPEARPVIAAAVQRAIECGEGYDLELQVITAKGARRWVRAIGHVNQQDGKSIEVLGTFQDITERKLTQEELKESELHRRLAVESNELKSAFLSKMSHELRTPLNSVIVLASVLRRSLANKIPAEEHGYLEVIERNGRNLLELINDVLDISRIEAGREELRIERFSVSELVDEIVAVIGPLAIQKSLGVKTQVPADLPVMVSDTEKCRRILMNLVGNAVKFTEKGHVAIEATVTRGELILSVTDTGIGIAPKDLSMIFEEFSQVDDTLARKYGGSGLGLAIALQYARMLGGTIEVSSVEGKGSTFTLRIPQSGAPVIEPE